MTNTETTTQQRPLFNWLHWEAGDSITYPSRTDEPTTLVTRTALCKHINTGTELHDEIINFAITRLKHSPTTQPNICVMTTFQVTGSTAPNYRDPSIHHWEYLLYPIHTDNGRWIMAMHKRNAGTVLIFNPTTHLPINDSHTKATSDQALDYAYSHLQTRPPAPSANDETASTPTRANKTIIANSSSLPPKPATQLVNAADVPQQTDRNESAVIVIQFIETISSQPNLAHTIFDANSAAALEPQPTQYAEKRRIIWNHIARASTDWRTWPPVPVRITLPPITQRPTTKPNTLSTNNTIVHTRLAQPSNTTTPVDPDRTPTNDDNQPQQTSSRMKTRKANRPTATQRRLHKRKNTIPATRSLRR